MSQKVYYDGVNNKEVVDVTGLKVEADVIAEFNLDVATQVLVTEEGDSTSVVNGTLTLSTKAQNDTAAQNAADAKEASRMGKETSTKAKLSLSDVEFADLKESLGL
jgi:hypothetical protein